MKKTIAIIGILLFTACSQIRESMDALDQNRQAVETSTAIIEENQRAIAEANIAINENRKQLEKITQTLGEAAK